MNPESIPLLPGIPARAWRRIVLLAAGTSVLSFSLFAGSMFVRFAGAPRNMSVLEWSLFNGFLLFGLTALAFAIPFAVRMQREAAAGYTTAGPEEGLNIPSVDAATGVVARPIGAGEGRARLAIRLLGPPIPVVEAVRATAGAGATDGARLKWVKAEYQPQLALNVWLRAGSSLSSAQGAQRATTSQWATLAVSKDRWDLFVSKRWRVEWLFGVPASEVTGAEQSLLFYGTRYVPGIWIRSHGVPVALVAIASRWLGTAAPGGYIAVDSALAALRRQLPSLPTRPAKGTADG